MNNPNQPQWGPQQQPWQPQQQYGQQPYGPPGYGQWQQPPPPPPRKPKKFLYWLVPLAVVVVAAAVVVPIVLTSGDSSPAPAAAPGSSSAPKPAAQVWQHAGNEVEKYEKGITTWTVGDDLVVVRDKYVTSYARTDGRQNWQTPAPSGGKFCGTGATVTGDKIALGFGQDRGCDHATVLNLADGALGWQQPMKVPQVISSAFPPEVAVLQIMGDTVFVAQEEGIAGLDLATGTQKWAKPLVRKADNEDGCKAADLLPQGEAVLLAMTCINGPFGLSLLMVDPATGNVVKEEDRPATSSASLVGIGLVSADPIVAYVSDGKSGAFGVFDDDLKKTADIPGGSEDSPDALPGVDSQGFGVDASGTEHHPGRLILTADVLITVTKPRQGSPNALVAYDLKTGQQRWKTPVADGTVMAPSGVDGQEVVAEVAPLERRGPQRVLRVGLADGKLGASTTTKINNAANDDNGPTAGFYRYLWADGRVYAVAGHLPRFSIDVFTLAAS